MTYEGQQRARQRFAKLAGWQMKFYATCPMDTLSRQVKRRALRKAKKRAEYLTRRQDELDTLIAIRKAAREAAEKRKAANA